MTGEVEFKPSRCRQTYMHNEYMDGSRDDLCDEWMSRYKPATIKRLRSVYLPEYSWQDIMAEVYIRFFRSVKADSITDERSINSYVFQIINSVIASKSRVSMSQKRQANLVDIDYAYDAESMDGIPSDSDLIIDCKNRLIGNKFGERVLRAMIGSNGKFSVSSLDTQMFLTEEEKKDPQTRKSICKAYNTICRVCSEECNQKYINVGLNRFGYSRRTNEKVKGC